MQITITLENAQLVRTGLQDLEADIPQIGKRQIRTVLNRVARRMEEYPERRPGQTYIRTGHLFSHWSIEPLQPDGYVMGNDVRSKTGHRYAVYVVGDARGERQAWMHKGRWLVFRKVLEQEIERLPEDVAKELELSAKRHHLK